MAEEKKKGWSLRGFLFEDEDTQAETQTEEAPPPAPPIPGSNPPPTPTASALPSPTAIPSVPAPVAVSVNPQIQEHLENTIAEKAPAGYADFLSNLNTLADVIPDERARFTAAIKLSAKDGFSPETILGDVDGCLGLLEDLEGQFQAETERQIAERVQNRHTEAGNIDQEVSDLRASIQELQERISQLVETRANTMAEANADQLKINEKAESFKVTSAVVRQKLSGLRAQIETYTSKEN